MFTFSGKLIILVVYISNVICLNDADPPKLKCPDSCDCSETFAVFTCRNIFKVTGHEFSSVTKEIHLTRNFHGPLLNGTFQNLNSLEVINISDSMVNFIQNGAFSGLSKLKQLILSGNSIELLDNTGELFKDTRQLEILDLSRNQLNFLPDEPFRFLPNLKVLNVSYNHLLTARLGPRFQVTTALHVLDFSGNKIDSVQAGDFAACHSWDLIPKSVNFSDCDLKTSEADAIKAFKNLDFLGLAHNLDFTYENMTLYLEALSDVTLKKLDLSYTNFSNKINLSDFTVDNLGRLSLQELYLAGNEFSSIDENLLSYLSLKKLDLRSNRLQSLDDGIAKLDQLKHLDLANNEISSVSELFKDNVGNLEFLSIANNKLTEASGLDLVKAVKAAEVDLSDNLLESFSIPRQLMNLKRLKLQRNKLSSFNNGEPLIGLKELTHLDVSENRLSALNAFMFRDSNFIEQVNFAKNEINTISHQSFVPNCPKFLDLSENKLETVHHFGWHDIETIILSKNLISEVHEQAFFFLHGLKNLDIHGNVILELPVDVFSQATNITSLDMHSNNMSDSQMLYEVLKPLNSLKYIDISFNNFTNFDIFPLPFSNNFDLVEINLSFNRLKSINPEVFSTFKLLKTVDFSRNPFHCGCENVELQNWLKTTSVQILNTQNYGYICRSPIIRGGKTLMDFEIKTFECNRNLFYIVLFSSIGGGAMFIAVAIAIGCYLVKCRRKGNLDIQSKSESVDLLGYEKKAKSDPVDEAVSPDHYVQQIRNNYIQGSPSDTLIDVEFENPNLLIDPRAYVRKVVKKPNKKSKPEKPKTKKRSVSKTKNGHKKPAIDAKKMKYYTQMYEMLNDPQLSRIRDSNKLRKDKDNLKKILAEMDKEYKKILEKKYAEKKHKKHHHEKEKRQRSRSHSRSRPRSRGNRDLVRMISLRQSRSMPDVMSYVNSLPRMPQGYRDGEYRYQRIPIYHVDHNDPGARHGWIRSMVDIPRGRDVSGDHRYESGARMAKRSERDVRVPSRHIENDWYLDGRIPHGYHTVSPGRQTLMIDSRYAEKMRPGSIERSLHDIDRHRQQRRNDDRRPTREMEIRLHREDDRHYESEAVPNGHVVRDERRRKKDMAVNEDETQLKRPLEVLSHEGHVSMSRGYHTIASVRGEKAGNVVTENFKPHRLDKTKSASADDHLSQWV